MFIYTESNVLRNEELVNNMGEVQHNGHGTYIYI